MINNLKNPDKCKIYLAINSTDNDDERVMDSKSDNIKIMINQEADEGI